MSDIAERALHTRTARSVEALQRSFIDNLYYVVGKPIEESSTTDQYLALAHTIRDRLLARLMTSNQQYRRAGNRTVAYLSAEFLLGPQLGNNIFNLDLWENTWANTQQALDNLGLSLDAILEAEPEPGLGNGGLGRLAACYLDSMATLGVSSIGYGIRYEYGIFDQQIQDGWQVEVADNWLRNGNPWEFQNRSRSYPVGFGGHTQTYIKDGREHKQWIPSNTIIGVAYDTPILGYGGQHANLLRLWKSEPSNTFDFQAFNHGDYYGAVDELVAAENISKVLYPNDEPEDGKRLRLKQQYFFVSCSLQDMLRMVVEEGGVVHNFASRFVAQLNDTHPAIGIPELMRLLVDAHSLNWDEAWEITRHTFAYTNHTLLPEALETWSLPLFRELLPRHMEIIFEINARFLDEVRTEVIDDVAKISRVSIIEESGSKRVRMANLACVGSFAINGVARMHSELLKCTVLRDFNDLWPEKFSNKTNGVTPRRFMAMSNRPLGMLLDETISEGWLLNPDKLKALEQFADDSAFQDKWAAAKRASKVRFSGYLQETLGIAVDPDSLFDVQAKRIHEYKRQHLNLLHVISMYLRIKHDPHFDGPPRTFIFSGKAAPAYRMAKLIIKLINAVADVVNHDPHTRDRLKVVFVPNMSVKLGQRLYPAADLSEQISTAGMEASGTGNMKFSMNGALTIGTLDGANVEIRDAVGGDNFFLFGRTVEEVLALKAQGYRSRDFIDAQPLLHESLQLVASGFFSHWNAEFFWSFLDNLWNADPYLVCADFGDYLNCHENVGVEYKNSTAWCRKSILNVSRIGYFSSDRSVREYCTDIWQVPV
ncbi:MAG: glycogen/starch/alpha-glucan phosphorylase [Gallionella sp.]|nr:glycogen/starch/alpha-glucan phosphorylase [Gallionella sp.]